MKNNEVKQLNGVALAYMGDAIYEVYVRRFILEKGVWRPTQFHHRAKHYVSAVAQSEIFKKMEIENFLTEDELSVFRKGRNAQSHTKAKNTDTKTYAISTGFEAMLGYLYLSEKTDRLEELIQFCFENTEWIEKYDPR
ncbi:MAG: Mini-ribonuclease 3 [Streptococcaceae bacterium]|jgi:ribonuclease-3 family protein|nr:Mini-ribonuclease 3 [Streptococcaceae bacterium]